MPFVRYLNLLSLVVWVGGLVFFAFVLAPTVFGVLPTRELAGNVVNRCLAILHWIGLCCGTLFAITAMIDTRVMEGAAHPFAARNLMIYLMVVLTLIGLFGLQSRMTALRSEMGIIDQLPTGDSRRIEFNRLHVWSTRLEGTVLVLGLAVLYLTSRRLS